MAGALQQGGKLFDAGGRRIHRLVDQNGRGMCSSISAEPRAAAYAKKLVAARAEINRSSGCNRDQANGQHASHFAAFLFQACNLRLAVLGVNGAAMGILLRFYRNRNREDHRERRCCHLTLPSVHRSPRRRTSDVANARPSLAMLSPFTGLLTGGDGPRSARILV